MIIDSNEIALTANHHHEECKQQKVKYQLKNVTAILAHPFLFKGPPGLSSSSVSLQEVLASPHQQQPGFGHASCLPLRFNTLRYLKEVL